MFCLCFLRGKNYFFFSSFLSILPSSFLGSAAGAAAGLEVSAAAGLAVSAGGGVAGAAGAAVAALAVESVLVASPLPLPQDATKRPNERASTLNFTNFILLFLDGYAYYTRNEIR